MLRRQMLPLANLIIEGKRQIAAFQNLKAQCAFKLAELVETHKIAARPGGDVDEITEDFAQIRQKDMDKDGKLKIVPKEEVREAWLYVAAVVDLFSRRVVGWSMSAAMTAQFVTDALMMAIWRRGKPDALLHHSDRGSQYTSEQFQRLIADHGVVCSMSRSGNVWDNAAMESFFSSLKTERTARKTYRTRDEAKADVFDYIERFYNVKRRHSTIGYMSPVEFEKQAELA
jgi:putative transposase